MVVNGLEENLNGCEPIFFRGINSYLRVMILGGPEHKTHAKAGALPLRFGGVKRLHDFRKIL